MFMVNVLKFRTLVACQKGTNIADPDQTASEAVLSGSALFAIHNSVKHFLNSSPKIHFH